MYTLRKSSRLHSILMAHLESEFPRAILNFPLSLQNDLGRTAPHINELHDHSSSGSEVGEGGGWGQETRGVKRSSTRNSGRVSGFAPDENGAIVISRGTRKTRKRTVRPSRLRRGSLAFARRIISVAMGVKGKESPVKTNGGWTRGSQQKPL